MQCTVWYKYIFDENDSLPANIEINICNAGKAVEFNKDYSKLYLAALEGENSNCLIESPKNLIQSYEEEKL